MFSCPMASLHAEPIPYIRPRPGSSHPFKPWATWEQTGLSISYFNLTQQPDEWHFWFSASFEGADSLVLLGGPSPGELNRVPPQFNTSIIRDYDRDLDGLTHPILSRASGLQTEKGWKIVQGSIGPRYRGGASELFPALFVQPPGEPWHHLGVPPREPARFVQALRERNATLRSEGGGLVQLPNGRLRMYLHGLVDPGELPDTRQNQRVAPNSLLVAEADHPEGPWTFLRNPEGKLVNILEQSRLPWLFAHVQPLGNEGFMLTGGSSWPPKALYAAYSRDGIHFSTPADENGNPVPLLEPFHEDALFMKALRGAMDPTEPVFHAFANLSRPQDRGASRLYLSRAAFLKEKLEDLLSP